VNLQQIKYAPVSSVEKKRGESEAVRATYMAEFVLALVHAVNVLILKFKLACAMRT